MSSRVVALAALAVGLAGEAVAIAASSPGAARWNEAAVGASVVAYGAVGLLILWYRPGHPIGRLCALIAPLWGVGQALVATSYDVLRQHPDARLAALGSTAGAVLRGLPWFIAVLWLPMRFPDGESGTHRRGDQLVLVTIGLFSLVSLLNPTLVDLRVGAVDNPAGLPHALAPVMNALAGANLLLGIVAICLAARRLVLRFRKGGPLDRQQTATFALAFVPPIIALAMSAVDAASPWVFGLASLPLPIAIGVAVLQRRLYDVQHALNRTLTYGMLTLAVAVLYAVTVGGVGSMLRQRGAPWLAWLGAGVVAVTFAPLRDALQRGANRLTYGQWAQPAEVLAATARRLGDASELTALLQTLVDEVATSLRLHYVAVTHPDGLVLAEHGTRSGDVDEVAMSTYGVAVGTLSWSRSALREQDRALLADLARQLGTVVHAAGLLDAVRASHERLVVAQEEERRRIRRDLHDGLGPTLAGLSLQVDTLRNRLAGHPNGVTDDALIGLRGGIQSAVQDVRRIVEGLRPPTLDELGLAEAVTQFAERTTAGSGLTVTVEAEALPSLPAAVESVAYRVVQEALTNVLRHSGARCARIRLHPTSDALAIEVSDDGSGDVRPRPGGVGLTSMRERVEQLHGSLSLHATPGEGTTIAVLLPAAGVEVS